MYLKTFIPIYCGPIPQIPKPPFYIYIFLLQMDLFLLQFMMSAKTDFDTVNFPFLDGDVPRRASYGVYISQLIRFAIVCNHVMPRSH